MINEENYVVDIEADNLLDEITKIHCLSYLNTKTKEVKSIIDYQEMRNFLNKPNLVIIGHNFEAYDKCVLEKILKIKIKARIIDTLFLSWLLFPTRNKHGLEVYGEEYSILKPKIEDWVGLNVSVYCNRCETDCRINYKIWENQWWLLNELYDDKDILQQYLRYVEFKARYIANQQFLGLRLDIPLAKESLMILEDLKQEKFEKLKEIMPKIPIIAKRTYPKVFKKANGELSANGLKWVELVKEKGLPDGYIGDIEVITGYSEANPNSHDQIKEFLYTLGWIPENIKHFRDKKKNEVRQIPQIKSKFDDSELCESIIKLIDKAPALEELNGYFKINHRISVFKGFLENQKNGFLYQGCSGLTPTMRIQQSILVNLPSANKPYAENIRRCIIARDNNHILINADLSGIEDSTKRHFIYKYDPDYVNEMNIPGYDPHLAMAVEAGFLTKEQAEAHKNGTENHKEIRGKSKVANFSLTYKVGLETLSRATGLSMKDTKRLRDAYWTKNKAILQIEDDLVCKQIGAQKWILNPLSGFWLALRNEKDKFSLLNQNTATYVFDLWIAYMIQGGLEIPFFYHDEVLIDAKIEEKDKVVNIINSAIDKVNNKLKLNITVACGIQMNSNYAEAH